jgi:hypothetical protein
MNAYFLAGAVVLAFAGSQAGAVTIAWADWQTASAGTATGTIAAPGGAVGVTHTGGYSFVQTAGGTPYWNSGTYNGAFNKPPGIDIVALNAGGAKVISFDKAVTDPYIALMSWNGNTVQFSAPFTVESNGPGYWGSGTPILNADSTGFFGAGEVHAIIRFSGTFTSIGFTDTTESWHGYTVGIKDVADVVPEPATWGMMIVGFGLVGAAMRRRAAVAA